MPFLEAAAMAAPFVLKALGIGASMYGASKNEKLAKDAARRQAEIDEKNYKLKLAEFLFNKEQILKAASAAFFGPAYSSISDGTNRYLIKGIDTIQDEIEKRRLAKKQEQYADELKFRDTEQYADSRRAKEQLFDKVNEYAPQTASVASPGNAFIGKLLRSMGPDAGNPSAGAMAQFRATGSVGGAPLDAGRDNVTAGLPPELLQFAEQLNNQAVATRAAQNEQRKNQQIGLLQQLASHASPSVGLPTAPGPNQQGYQAAAYFSNPENAARLFTAQQPPQYASPPPQPGSAWPTYGAALSTLGTLASDAMATMQQPNMFDQISQQLASIDTSRGASTNEHTWTMG